MGLKFTPTNFLFLEADSRKKDIVIIWTPKKNATEMITFPLCILEYPIFLIGLDLQD